MEATERNVSATECERATCHCEIRPKSREPDPQPAGSENRDKKQKPGPTGISVRRGSQDCPAQPEAQKPGELK